MHPRGACTSIQVTNTSTHNSIQGNLSFCQRKSTTWVPHPTSLDVLVVWRHMVGCSDLSALCQTRKSRDVHVLRHMKIVTTHWSIHTLPKAIAPTIYFQCGHCCPHSGWFVMGKISLHPTLYLCVCLLRELYDLHCRSIAAHYNVKNSCRSWKTIGCCSKYKRAAYIIQSYIRSL